MTDDMSVSLKKVKFDNCDGEFFLYSRYELGKKFYISLFNVKNSEAYRGEVSDIDLRSMAATRRMLYANFLTDTVCAITCDDSSQTQYLYSLDKDAGDFFFRWKKVIDAEDIKVNLGRIKVSRADYCSVIETVLCQVSVELLTLSKSLKQTKAELEESKREKEKSEDFVQNAIKMKEDMEKELYAKFVVLLNKKKEKIRKLKERAAASTPESDSDSEAVVVKGRKRTKKMPGKSQSKRVSPCVMSATEEEDEDSPDSEELFSKPGPSTCREHSFNSSLLLDEDFDDQCPVQEPRQRHRRGNQRGDTVPSPRNDHEVNEDDSFFSTERNEAAVTDDSAENLLDML